MRKKLLTKMLVILNLFYLKQILIPFFFTVYITNYIFIKIINYVIIFKIFVHKFKFSLIVFLFILKTIENNFLSVIVNFSVGGTYIALNITIHGFVK